MIAQDGTLFPGNHLPGNDIRVVFERGKNDFIAGKQKLLPEGLGGEIDCLGGASGEDDFLDRRRAEEILDLLAGAFVGIGGTRCQGMGGPMDVGIIARVESGQARR